MKNQVGDAGSGEPLVMKITILTWVFFFVYFFWKIQKTRYRVE
jgi:hypothetical protein